MHTGSSGVALAEEDEPFPISDLRGGIRGVPISQNSHFSTSAARRAHRRPRAKAGHAPSHVVPLALGPHRARVRVQDGRDEDVPLLLRGGRDGRTERQLHEEREERDVVREDLACQSGFEEREG